jgi:large subunit ribosomal protein L15
MQLHNLKPAEGSVQKTKRIGRGEGSGHGGTATRGSKGQQARTGYQSKKGHEGGQMPIQRRMPKRGFKNPFRVEYKVFNLGQLDELIEKYSLKEFSPEELYVSGLISRTDLVKVLATGESAAKIAFKVHAMSAKAKAALEAAGATVELIGQ